MEGSTEIDASHTTGPLTPPDQFLAPCPKFRILVLGNPESTKQELFSKVFGVDLDKKLVSHAFDPDHHNIHHELFLDGQNNHLSIFTSPNLLADDERTYHAICDFLDAHQGPDVPLAKHIHMIWYCAAAEEDRPVSDLGRRFFANLATIAPHVPVVLLFTKYEEFLSRVQLDWAHDAQERGMSKVAVTHILRDLATKRFDETIGKKWDDALLVAPGRSDSRQRVPRVCVQGGGEGDSDESFEQVVTTTLGCLRERDVKVAFAAAQRCSASISTEYTADLAASYFTLTTGHARKASGVDTRDIIPNFFAKAIQLFNLRDVSALLTAPALPSDVLHACFAATPQRLLLDDALHAPGTESTILLGLSPHERAVLLTQCLTHLTLFLHKLAETQWPHRAPTAGRGEMVPATLTRAAIDKAIAELRDGTERTDVLERVESSRVFSECNLPSQVADLIARTVELVADGEAGVTVGAGGSSESEDSAGGSYLLGAGGAGADTLGDFAHGRHHHHHHHHKHGRKRSAVVVDDSELAEISLSFVNDKGPDDMFLPCGLRILKLN